MIEKLAISIYMLVTITFALYLFFEASSEIINMYGAFYIMMSFLYIVRSLYLMKEEQQQILPKVSF